MVTDKRDTLITYLTEGLKICNGLCNTCPTKDPIIMYDEQLLNDPPVRNSLEERRRYSNTTETSAEYVCSLWLTLGRKVKNYALKDKSAYRNLLLSASGNLIFDSAKLPNPLKMKKIVVFAIKDLDDSKKEVPFVPETTKVILHREPIIEVPTSRMSVSARRFLDYP